MSDRSDDDASGRLRSDAPMLDGWLAYRSGGVTPFTTPGHKRQRGLVGAVVRDDIPLYGGVDTIRSQFGRRARADAKVAELWGADWGRISVGGSTHGNQALCMAVARPGDTVVVNRNIHRSLLVGLILAGLRPVWVTPQVDRTTGLPIGVPADRLAAALHAHPEARAVFLVEPSYVGTLSDVAAHADLAHAHGIPLVVDQAWGAYLGFHPDLPPHALQAGADAMVTSAHKTLPAYTQSAYVVARTERVDPDRLDRAFEATATTSPSGTIAASADAARALLALDGERLLGDLIDVVRHARALLADVPGLVVVDERSVPGSRMDPAKLVLSLAGTGADGIAVEDDLVAAGFPVELADRDTLVPLVTMADDRESVEQFVTALVPVLERHRGEPRDVVPSVVWSMEPETVLDPRTAFFAEHETVPVDDAVGRVSAELVAPYPPGIPVLAPGDRVTGAAVRGLHRALDEGTQVRYAADPSLRTLQVLVDP